MFGNDPKHLGPSIDIHGGGKILRFPITKTNSPRDVAPGPRQLRTVLDAQGMLTMGTEKMSKSVGNIVTIQELLKPMTGGLRYALLSGQYRQSLVWEERLLVQAGLASTHFIKPCAQGPQIPQTPRAPSQFARSVFPGCSTRSANRRLEHALALAALHAIASKIHIATSERESPN
ncbi:MAG: hypothetical protein CM1200mP9_07660 [Gammaproteobacteria bacterium]|nr:MAG: hypothetical protein CM1200mP9_07660 [Gammaproteobacteria bacterium]